MPPGDGKLQSSFVRIAAIGQVQQVVNYPKPSGDHIPVRLPRLLRITLQSILMV